MISDRTNIKSLITRITSTKTGEYYEFRKRLEKLITEYSLSGFSEALYVLDNSLLQSDLFCPVCKEKKKKFNTYYTGYFNTCSTICGNKYSINKQNRENSILEKYKSKNYFTSNDFLEKREKKLDRIYNKRVQEKKEKTFLERHQSKNPMGDPIIVEKNKKANKLKSWDFYLDSFKSQSVIPLFSKEDYLKKDLSKDLFLFQCIKCKNTFEEIIQKNVNRKYKCTKCSPPRISQVELEILDYLKTLVDSKIETNSRKIIPPKELDLYLPEYNLGIEYNGLMFHSFGKSNHSMFNNYNLEKEYKNYHLNKTNECQEKGIQLLHVFENEWLNSQKQDIWKSIIKSKLSLTDRLFARKLTVKSVLYQESKDFLNTNHLQGEDKSSLRLGLYQKNESGEELISIMTFGKSRYDKKVAWELHRFATKQGGTVVGGASKLFSYFKKNYLQSGESVISYADRRHSNGNLYEKLGFILSHISSPNYFYFKENNYTLESRVNFQKHKLKEKLEVFDDRLTESENMYNNGYRKVYDSGNLVYVFNYQK